MQKTMEAINIVNFKDTINVRFEQIRLCPHCNVSTNNDKASAWIGNDETHYQRKHENYDINHLKSFIHATVSTIDSDLEVINAQQLLNK